MQVHSDVPAAGRPIRTPRPVITTCHRGGRAPENLSLGKLGAGLLTCPSAPGTCPRNCRCVPRARVPCPPLRSPPSFSIPRAKETTPSAPRLAHVTEQNVLQVRPCCCAWRISLLKAEKGPSGGVRVTCDVRLISYVRSSVRGHRGRFHALATADNVAMNVGCRYLCEVSAQKGAVGSHGSSGLRFVRTLRPVVHGGCPTLHSHPRGTRAPFPPRLCGRLSSSGQ